MNTKNYTKWLKEILIPNLPPKSVLVVDNASYHNTQFDKPPTSNSLVKDMKSWLTEKNIPFPENFSKTKLYELIKLHKPRQKSYVIDSILAEHGHTALRLPPYHPDLNPIELIWSDVKEWVGQRNTTFKINEVERLCRQRFEEIGREKWENVCSHVDKIEQHYFEKDGLVENRIEQILIQDDGVDSSDSDFSVSVSENVSEHEFMSGVEELD